LHIIIVEDCFNHSQLVDETHMLIGHDVVQKFNYHFD